MRNYLWKKIKKYKNKEFLLMIFLINKYYFYLNKESEMKFSDLKIKYINIDYIYRLKTYSKSLFRNIENKINYLLFK